MRLSCFVRLGAPLLLLVSCVNSQAQEQMASLRPGGGLVWKRTSPSIQQPDGPVLYQLIFNASGVAGTVPVFDSNPRHLANSPITISGGNVVIGGGSALSINGSSGLITFAPGQSFPISGLPNLAGEVLGAPSATVVSNAVATDTANAIVRRDASGNFSAATISLDGSLDIPFTASSSVGVIAMGGHPVLHMFGNSNTFLGQQAGNFTTSGFGENTGIGQSTLLNVTTGRENTTVGYSALLNNTTGDRNSAVGSHSLTSNTTGTNNSAFGANVLSGNTTGASNAAFGNSALAANTTGSNNSALGFGALTNNSASNNSAFGFSALNHNTTGSGNAAFGFSALSANTTAGGNSAFGGSALQANTLGGANSAFGYNALNANDAGNENSAFGNAALLANTGNLNSAFGSGALLLNSSSANNAAFGAHALLLSTDGDNSAFGFNALSSLTSGFGNTAIGDSALSGLGASSSYNIAIGFQAGQNLQSGNHNIYIGNAVGSNESNTIRIGQQGLHGATLIGGIYGAASASGATVFVNAFGQLGTFTSSRRYKRDIADLGAESDVLMKLRPVAFYYKPELDGTHTRQYGLVAEEVAQIAPGLVIFDKDGRPETVRYHFVNAIVLNEVQKQRRLIEKQQRENEEQRTQNQSQQRQLGVQQQQIEALEQKLRAMMTRLEVVEASSQRQARSREIASSR
jgi:hypothetical protein